MEEGSGEEEIREKLFADDPNNGLNTVISLNALFGTGDT